MKTIGVIPARYNSSRLPGKPLLDICGKPMVWWVYQRAKMAQGLDRVIVATDDSRIYDVCRDLGLDSMMTSTGHATPTDRVWEVSIGIDAELYLVMMGDEPLLDPNCISLILPEKEQSQYYVAALSNVIHSAAEVIDFSNQKVVTNEARDVLLISRSPIPYPKGTLDIEYEKVTGVQIFSKAALDFYHKTKRSALERAEENDLMRFVEHGIPVKMICSPYKTISVDTLKDLEEVRGALSSTLTNMRTDIK